MSNTDMAICSAVYLAVYLAVYSDVRFDHLERDS